MSDIYAVVLAAGKGTRMKSKLYKVLHPVCGKPMVQHVIDSLQNLNPTETMVVVGHGAQLVQEQVGSDGITYVLQEEQLGTGHAVKMARERLANKDGITLVVCGDTPLLTEQTLSNLIHAHKEKQADVTVLTTHVVDPTGYGRMVRNEEGNVNKIVEQKEATPKELEITEINTGVYAFSTRKLLESLDKVSNDNVQGEYYLTDCVQVLNIIGGKVSAYITNDADEIMGINDRVALAEAEQIMRKRINRYHMREGVTIIDPMTTYIGADVVIGQDTVVQPGTTLSGKITIGEDCIIGPGTELRDVVVGKGTTIQHSVATESEIGDGTSVGPYAYIRPGSKIGNGCKIGDFVEVKNSRVEDGTKIPHLSYIGDAHLGKNVNMGCGSITVNYDGNNKHQTTVEDGAFVGCNVNLIAPVTIGKGSYVAAGSTINKSTPDHSFAIAREKQVTKENYVEKLKRLNKKK
jgi:bifunctional UDP-N-acetylglucosamine pyrophosphorylase/glucosamine-1-phosphate N-acetyltransferase